MPVAHVYNPCYLGGKDQEEQGWKPVKANSSKVPISEKTHHKKGPVQWFKV
jgi:hypothetical protein